MRLMRQKVDELKVRDKIADVEERKREIITITNIVKEELSGLVLQNYEHTLLIDEINVLKHYFRTNLFYLEDIKTEEINMNIIKAQYIDYFNSLRRRMSINEKYKMNVTFDLNINLLNIKNNSNLF